MLTDYHLHTPLCRHAEGWPIDYAKTATELGLEEIGFSDHSPMAEPFDDWRMLLQELPRYFEAVEEARAAYPKLPIRLGLEVDFITGHETWIEYLTEAGEWDYLIGSVHYIAEGWDIDNPKHISRYQESSIESIWDMYWKSYERCIRSGLFDFVAHPDLPKKFGFRPRGDLRRYYEPAVTAMVETGIAFEINTAGLRKPVGECYPSLEFLRLAHSAGVGLLINSDAHAPGEVGAGFELALALAKEAGYRQLVRFENRKRTLVSI